MERILEIRSGEIFPCVTRFRFPKHVAPIKILHQFLGKFMVMNETSHEMVFISKMVKRATIMMLFAAVCQYVTDRRRCSGVAWRVVCEEELIL